MCASYGAASEYNLLHRTYKVEFPPLVVLPQQIIYPHTLAPVITSENKHKKLELMNYSLIPSWSKTRKPKFATYNARIEEVLVKPSWKEPFASRHCLVPVVKFYESSSSGEFEGHRIGITSKKRELMTAAGIWDQWFDQEKRQWVRSFAILTTEPTEQIIQAGHDRSPIFLKEEAFDGWLNDSMAGDLWIKFVQDARLIEDYAFEKGERLKSFTGQMALFSDEE